MNKYSMIAVNKILFEAARWWKW